MDVSLLQIGETNNRWLQKSKLKFQYLREWPFLLDDLKGVTCASTKLFLVMSNHVFIFAVYDLLHVEGTSNEFCQWEITCMLAFIFAGHF